MAQLAKARQEAAHLETQATAAHAAVQFCEQYLARTYGLGPGDSVNPDGAIIRAV